MTPYKIDKVTIGKNYQEPFKPVQFTKDEEFIQDLLLENKVKVKVSDTFELVACYIVLIFTFSILVWGFR
jgi:hypothetical protein